MFELCEHQQHRSSGGGSMAVPYDALQVIAVSLLSAALFEAVTWLLFYRTGSYGRQIEQLERMGKKLEEAQDQLAADPVGALRRMGVSCHGAACALRAAVRRRLGLRGHTAATVLGGQTAGLWVKIGMCVVGPTTSLDFPLIGRTQLWHARPKRPPRA